MAQGGQIAPPRAPAPESRAVEAVAESAEASDEPATETPSDTADVEVVASFVESWRSAWQEQRVDDYLASYSEGFEPESGLSRERWEQQRRQRLTAPEFIRVTLAYLDEPRVDGDQASIRFLQSYESDTFQDRVSKVLVLTWEDGGWKILEERAE